VINGKKKIVYDLEGAGNYGHAGEDNMTIHLAKDAILRGTDAGNNAKVAWYTSTFVKEGMLIDEWSNWENDTGIKSSDAGKGVKHDMEQMASANQAIALRLLKENTGIGTGYDEKMQNNLLSQGVQNVMTGGMPEYAELEAMVNYSAITGDPGMFDWGGGRDSNAKKNLLLNSMYKEALENNDIESLLNVSKGLKLKLQFDKQNLINQQKYLMEMMKNYPSKEMVKPYKNFAGKALEMMEKACGFDLGKKGVGYYGDYASDDDEKFLNYAVGFAFTDLAAEWFMKTGKSIYVGDGSQKGGGNDFEHHTHRYGFQMDIKFITTDGSSGKSYNYDDPNSKYDQAATIDLIKDLFDYQSEAGNPNKAKVYSITFGDKKVIDYFSEYKDGNGKNPYEQYLPYLKYDNKGAHDSHLHISWQTMNPNTGKWVHSFYDSKYKSKYRDVRTGLNYIQEEKW
jgi:hypothetical protein